MLTTARRTLLIGIPIAMLILLVSWVNHLDDYAARLAPTPVQVTKITEDDPRWDCRTMGNHVCGPPKTVDIAEAEHDAYAAMVDMEPTCEAQGLAAQAWAEINSTQPNGYEVISQCLRVTVLR